MGYLFADGLGLITLLLRLCLVINLMRYYFLLSWMPTLLTGEFGERRPVRTRARIAVAEVLPPIRFSQLS